jgi:hypothetical protein
MELRGWKAIAAHLKKSERMCRYYLECNPPIPVYQWGGAGEVVAQSDEIDLWNKTRLRHRAAKRIANHCQPLPATRRNASKTRRSATP